MYDERLLVCTNMQRIFLWDISQGSTIMMNAVLPSSIPTASNNTSYVDQVMNLGPLYRAAI